VRILIEAVLICLVVAACDGDDGESFTPTPSATSSPTPVASPPTASPEPVTPTPGAPAIEPAGFPVRPETRLGVVEGTVGSRRLVFNDSGPAALDYAAHDMVSADPDIANRSGWNCETHWEYEGIPAVDFYIPVGTPLLATMDGTATLNIISTRTDFDRYGVDREPYLGNPDRSHAPYSPFPGSSGGLGVYVKVENAGFATEYGHMEIGGTVAAIPASGFIDGYTMSTDYSSMFADVPSPRVITAVARWAVRRGDIIGVSGDAGYSEGPHVHYTVNRTGGPLRCPTQEAGFADGGWLFK
jgi:murein DD-endopeptidase MepM/ murein hydrolase activator NlpD